MIRILLPIVLIISNIIIFTAKAQVGCGTDELRRRMQDVDPSYLQKFNAYRETTRIQAASIALAAKNARVVNGVATIPVVVHIIAPPGVDANTFVTDQQVRDGISHLNQGFSNSGSYQVVGGVNTNIQFCLAQQDIIKNYTSGITRLNHGNSNLKYSGSSPDENAIKDAVMTANSANGVYKYDPHYYLNIYLVNDILGPVAAYAYLPVTPGDLYYDGIMCEAGYFGASITNSKVIIHEAGHYLGVLHTFEGNCPSGNCPSDLYTTCPANHQCDVDGDGICDTPPDKSTASYPCNAVINTCSTDIDDTNPRNPFRPGALGDQPDMISNHMDYGDLVCHTSFTAGQSNRMNATLASLRSSLMDNNLAIGCLSPCPNPLKVKFTPSTTSVTLPASVSFSNTTTGDRTGYIWSWDFGDGTTSTLQSPPAKQYLKDGAYTIKLIATNGNVSCQRDTQITVTAVCPLTPGFTVNGLSQSVVRINVGDTIKLKSTATGGATLIEWLQDGVAIGTGLTFSKTFASISGVMISQRISNSNCNRTSENSVFIDVNRCGGSSGQERDNWVFGGGNMLKFNNGIATVSSTATPFAGNFAVSSISDSEGKLLLYSNCDKLYDREGGEIDALNNISYFQGATQTLLVQHPDKNQSNIYYQFLPNYYETGGYFSYLTIDMNKGSSGLDGKPLGAVVQNQKILSSGSFSGVAAVKVNTIDGDKIYVVTFNTIAKQLFVYTIDKNGLDSVPVLTDKPLSTIGNIAHRLKISPDGLILAVGAGDTHIELYKFDPQLGVPRELLFSTSEFSSTFSAEFSADASKLYVTGSCPNYINPLASIFQVDLKNDYKIYPIDLNLHVGNSNGIGDGNGGTDMQMGPDGKIYIRSDLNYLYTINSPNALGSLCDFGLQTITTPYTNHSPFPGFVVDLTGNKLKIIGASCVAADTNGVQFSSSIVPQTGETLTWSVTQTTPALAEIKSTSGANATLNFYGAGTVKLKIELNSPCGYLVDEKVIQVGNAASLNLGPDQGNCNGSAVILDAGPGYKNYLWSDGSTEQSITTSATGTYSVKVTDNCGVEATDYIKISNGNTTVTLSTVNDEPAILVPTCHPSVTLKAGYLATYTWKKNNTLISGATSSTLVVTQAGTYTVEGVNNRNCFASASIEVIDGLSITGDDKICPGQKAALQVNIAGITGDYYVQWIQNGGTPTTTPTGLEGSYYAMVVLPQFAGCTLTTAPKTVKLLLAPSPYTVSTDKNFLCGDVATLTAKAPAYTAVPIINNIWTNGMGQFTGMPASNVVTNVTMWGGYFVTSIDSNGCTAISNIVSLSAPVIMIKQRCTSGGIGTELIGDLNIPNGNYVWKDATGTTVATTQSYIPSIPGTYTVSTTSTRCPTSASAVTCTAPTSNLGTNLVTRGDFNITGVTSPICTNYAVSSDLTCSDATTTPLNSGTWPSNFKITSNAGPENLNKWSGTGFSDPAKPNDIYCLIADGRVTVNDERVWYQQVSVENCATYTFRALIDNIIINEAEIPRVWLCIKNGSNKSLIKGTTVFASQKNWVELSGTWKSPLTGTVELSVMLDGGGFVGRDIAIDEIYFAKTNCSSLDDFRSGRSCKAVTDVGMNKLICSGQSVQIGMNANIDPNLTYSWSAPNFSSTAANPTITPTGTNTYKLVVTDNVNNCTATDYVTVTVIIPEITITKDLTTGCTATQVKANLFSGIANPQYEWYVNGTVTATNTTGLFSLTGIAAGSTIKCRLVTACSPNIYSNTITVGTSAPVTATQTSICTGTSTQLHANMSGGTAPFTYTWTASTGAVPAAVSDPTVSPTATTTYSLNYHDANNCTFTGSVTVTVNALPQAVTVTPAVACVGVRTTFYVIYGSLNTLIGSSNPSMLESGAELAIPNGFRFAANITNAGTGNFVYVSKNSAGCSATSVIAFTASAPPPMKIIVTPNPVCLGTTITVSVNEGVGNANPSFTDPAGLISRIGGSRHPEGYTFGANAIAVGTGNFVGISTNAQGCSTTVSVPLTVNALPGATIQSTGMLICSGLPVQLSTLSAGASFQWYMGGAAISGATSTTYNTSAAGAYTMKVTDANTCQNTSAGITLTSSTAAVPRIHVDDASVSYCVSTPSSLNIGKAIQLNGTNQYVNVPGLNFPTSGNTYGGPITVEFWINSTSTPNSVAFSIGGLNSSNRAQAHVPHSDGNLYWDYGDFQANGRIFTSFTAYLGKWTHVALVSAGNGGSFKAIYLNGIKVASSTAASDGPDQPLSGLTIGRWMNYAYYQSGMMDEFRIWNKVLSDAEVAAAMTTLYKSGTPNLMGSWGFDEASGTTVKNDAFSTQPGTIVNSATRVYPSTLTYTWSPAAYLNTSGGTTVIPNTTVSRTYIVKGVDATGCSAYTTIVVTPNNACKDVVDVSVEEPITDWDVEIYPNPTEGDVHISFVNISDDTNLSIEVIGMDGAVILNLEHVGVHEVCNLRELPSGLYLIRVRNGEETKTRKVVVVK